MKEPGATQNALRYLLLRSHRRRRCPGLWQAGNTDRKTSPELLSRFDTRLYIPSYSFDDFITVCTQFLSKHDSIPEELAEYIGRQTWALLDKDVRTARGIARQIREHTASELDRVIGIRRKYSRRDIRT